MVRIWKAFAFMTLVDTYGDVPYSDAGKVYLEGINYPKYDKMADIYANSYLTIAASSSTDDSSGCLPNIYRLKTGYNMYYQTLCQ